MKNEFNFNSTDVYGDSFRTVALSHNVRSSKLIALIVGSVSLVLFLIGRFSNVNSVLIYPGEYATAIEFVLVTSVLCYAAFIATQKMAEKMRQRLQKIFSDSYAVVIVISSLWLTFVMQHNPSNTMSVFVLGILTVAALWIFEKKQTLVIALLMLLLFDGGLHFFQTDTCKLFTNYITGTCVSIFFVCISRVCFRVNYNHFVQLKKIEKNNHDLAAMNQLQSRILSVVAHDLRSPNNQVIALIQLAKDPAMTNDERNEFYDLILNICRNSNETIEDLLKIARNETKGNQLIKTPLNDFINEIILKYRKIVTQNQKLIFNQPAENIFAEINRQKMSRVIENLLSNALKFTGDDGIISITLKSENGLAYIKVRDNGIGIPQAMIPHVFSNFTIASRKGIHGEESHGLGLSICKLIVEQHHGEISVESEEGKGTEFSICLPGVS